MAERRIRMGDMQSMFNPSCVEEIEGRLLELRVDSARVWGTMSAGQMVKHCRIGVEMATGDCHLPRVFVGRLLGPVVKRFALGNDEPMRRNSPTAPGLVVDGEVDFEVERERLVQLIDRFAAGGAAKCTTHPHAFFGKLTPEEWAELVYKHLDHHLRQFGFEAPGRVAVNGVGRR
jgi:hypothetical protein